jgi:hypothetical protein
MKTVAASSESHFSLCPAVHLLAGLYGVYEMKLQTYDFRTPVLYSGVIAFFSRSGKLYPFRGFLRYYRQLGRVA